MSILDGFENYARTGRCYKARISVSSSGWLAINSTAYRELALDNYKFAGFYYNQDSKMIGIKFTPTEQDGMYEMNPRPGKGNEKALYMSIKGFVQTYKIVERKETKKYEIFKTESAGSDLIVLLKPIVSDKEVKIAENNKTENN